MSQQNDTIMHDSVVFNLRDYIHKYAGLGRVWRLQSCFQIYENQELKDEALKLMVDELKEGLDYIKYQTACEMAGPQFGKEYEFDRQRFEAMQNEASTKRSQLEQNYSYARSSANRDASRVAGMALGDCNIQLGQLHEALKDYLRCIDYCSTLDQYAAVYTQLVIVNIFQGQFQQMVKWAKRLPEGEIDMSIGQLAKSVPIFVGMHENDVQIAISKRLTALGIGALQEKKYQQAAEHFTKVSPLLGNTMSEVLNVADVALYGALTAMAGLERHKIGKLLQEDSHFKEILAQQHSIQIVLESFYKQKFAECMMQLEQFDTYLKIDPLTKDVREHLLRSIKDEAIATYVQPFCNVQLTKLTQALGVSQSQLVEALPRLISSGKVQGLLDLQHGLLLSSQNDKRANTLSNCLAAAEQLVQVTHVSVFRNNLMRHSVVVVAKTTKQGPEDDDLDAQQPPSPAQGRKDLVEPMSGRRQIVLGQFVDEEDMAADAQALVGLDTVEEGESSGE